MEKRSNIILFAIVLIFGIFLCRPIVCYAWSAEDTSVSNVVVRDGRLESFDFHFNVPSGFAETQSWLGLQSVKFNNADLTNEGVVYEKNYANISALNADDNFRYNYGIELFSKKGFSCFGNHININETLSDISIDSDANGVYYVYLWTLNEGVFYPDVLLATIEFNNGIVRVIDSSENEMLEETFENLEAPVVEKIEINDANFKLKVGESPKFTAKIKNNSNSFNLVETFMSLDRESTFSSDSDDIDDYGALIEDYIYYYIGEIYIKDNVNLKFDETTKVYINGVEQSKNNIYVSAERMSIANEQDTIIPEGYAAPAYLEETFKNEQKSIIENIVLEAIRAGKVLYDDDSVNQVVNEAIENNKTISIDFFVTESISKSRGSHFYSEETINAINSKVENNKLVAYYDIIIEVYVDNYFVGNIAEISTPLSVTIPYPNGIPELKNGYKRLWKVIRYHNGQVDVLDGKRTNNGISFESDKYSVFALTYEDVKLDEINNPKTGDNITFLIGILVVSFLSVISMIKGLKRRRY